MIQKAVILSTGDEITTGRIVDTNSNYIADKLAEVGIEVVAVLTVGDLPERLEWAWKTAMAMADVVISTGGIGPTADDLTNETVARITGRKLVRDQESVDHMKRIFASINRIMPENNLKQADLPETSEVIRNPLGTAPGFRMAVPQTDGHISHLVVMPGVPREMKPMMEDSVIPWLKENRGSDTIYAVRVFQTFGISESGLDEAVAGLIKPEEARVAFRAAFPQISLRVTVEGKPGKAERKLEELSERVRGRIANFVYAEGNASMEEVVAQLLTERKLKLAVAESCTGGLIGHRLTNVPGSSKFFIGDFVTYSNDLKTGLLGVREETLKQHGAVSEQCVLEMATGARESRRRPRDCDLGRRRSRRRHPRASGGHGLRRPGGEQRHSGCAPLPVTRQPRLDKDSHRTGRAGLAAPLRTGIADWRIDAVPPLKLSDF
jgi:nicotinamide-nucleotide amidase